MIYLDHNATTPILPEVLEAMMPYLTTEWGNPSSAYKFGSKLKPAIATAREQVAELLGAHSPDILCASSGSACLADSDEPSHVVLATKPNAAAFRQMIRFSMDAAAMQAQIRSVVNAVKRATEALSRVASQS